MYFHSQVARFAASQRDLQARGAQLHNVRMQLQRQKKLVSVAAESQLKEALADLEAQLEASKRTAEGGKGKMLWATKVCGM